MKKLDATVTMDKTVARQIMFESFNVMSVSVVGGNFFCAKRCEVGQTCRDNEDCVTNICSAVDSVCAEPSKLPLVLKRVFVDMVVENIW